MSGYRARYADCEPVVASVTPAWYLMPNGTCIGVEVVRYDKGCKTDIFRLGTCTKLSPFDPARLSYDNPCAAAEFEWPEGGPFFVNKYDAAGEPTVGPIDLRNTLGAELPEDITAGSYIVYNTVDAEGNITGADAEAIRQSPTGLSIPQRSETGQIRAQNPLAPFDVVNLRYLDQRIAPATLVESICNDDEATEDLINCLTTNEDWPGLPAGVQYQVITYDENNVPVAGYLDIMGLSPDMAVYLETLPGGTAVAWGTFVLGETRINTPLLMTPRPIEDSGGIQQIAQRLNIGADENAYVVLQTQTAPDGVVAGETDDNMVVNKAYLKSQLPNFHAEEVGVGAFVADLATVGTYTGDTACITVDNSTGLYDMTGIARFTSFSGALRRVGNGAAYIYEQLSYDGGTTWIDLAPNRYDRAGADAALSTAEVSLLTRAAAFTIPAGETVTICSRVSVVVETAYGAGSITSTGHELEVIAGTQRP